MAGGRDKTGFRWVGWGMWVLVSLCKRGVLLAEWEAGLLVSALRELSRYVLLTKLHCMRA